MRIGVHYEYPFGGMMKDRPEWKPKGAKDWRLELKVVFGSAMFYVSDAFVRKYPDSATVTAKGERIPKMGSPHRCPGITRCCPPRDTKWGS
jgi:hypothetical protein